MIILGHTHNYSTEIFRIHRVKNTIPITYTLIDYKDQIIAGSFYKEELKKVKYPDFYLISEVVDCKHGKARVRYYGMDETYDTWEDIKSVDPKLLEMYYKNKKKNK